MLVRETARLLGLPETAIRVPYPDTALTPPDAGTNSSRSSFFNGVAVRRAADDLRRQLRELAARVHEVPADSPSRRRRGACRPAACARAPASQAAAEPAQGIGGPLADGRRVADRGAGLPEGASDGLPFATLLQAAGVAQPRRRRRVPDDDRHRPGHRAGPRRHHWHQGAAGAVVEVDRETGKVYLLRLHVATHAGRVIDRANAELQNEGCATFGLSQALFEEILLDDGQVTNPNLSDYMIPSLPDFPRAFTTTLAESPLVARDDAPTPRSSYPRCTGWARRACPPSPRRSAMPSPPLSARRAAPPSGPRTRPHRFAPGRAGGGVARLTARRGARRLR